ncbi:MAG: putative metal-dependent hydrolase [Flavobacteriaceae bacterium]|jgi:hypothetical protein|nr:putative metal-dependent hydrolase [Flavobacteriaceae bacterium]
MNIEELRYPIGKFNPPEIITPQILDHWIEDIASFPQRLKKEVEYLSEEQLDTPYRPEGWTIRQVVHHCADSHMNSFIRFKLALTENNPTVKPYFEALWAELPDYKSAPLEPSIKILEGVHQRWVIILQSLSEEDRKKSFFHPKDNKTIYLDEVTGIYAWHGNHHLAHITTLKKSKNW